MTLLEENIHITTGINKILISYAKDNVLRRLLTKFAFDDKGKITDLIVEVNRHGGGDPSPDQVVEMTFLICDFLKTLEKKELMALYFWLIDCDYDKYLEELISLSSEEEEEAIADLSFNEELSKLINYFLKNPKGYWLDEDLDEQLYWYLINFSSCFDLSLVDKYSYIEIKEKLNSSWIWKGW